MYICDVLLGRGRAAALRERVLCVNLMSLAFLKRVG